ncbi:MAG TPA: hypothetical protein VES89_09865 [Candidatus Competibacteraceae bacterium]|nr:hypothetical protein [Candidatus Competibacteraceae bacterium]
MRERTLTSPSIELNCLADDPTWPTQCQDVLAAMIILHHHVTGTREPLCRLEGGGEANPDPRWVQWPAWLLDLSQHYRVLYGEAGEPILQRVLQKLLPGEPLHSLSG